MSPVPRSRRTRVIATLGAGATLLTLGAALAPASFASSHREAPLIAGDPRADNTDTYAFVSPDAPDTVTLIANWYPFEEPNGGPNFYTFATDARYNINIDNNGDGVADVVYRWTFKNHVRDAANQFLYNTGQVQHLYDKDLNVFQTYQLTEVRNGKSTVLIRNQRVAPSDVGPASIPNYGRIRNEAIRRGQLPKEGGQTYVGQADDPFFLDLRVFDLLYGTNFSESGQDTLDGYNVNTIALQVPSRAVVLHHKVTANPVIGVWSTTERRSTVSANGGNATGRFVQVSRLGNPLVNEAVVPLKYKDAFNQIAPAVDHTIGPVVAKVLDPIVPHLIESVYGIPAPAAPRDDLFEIFLTGLCKKCGPIKADLNSQRLNQDVRAKDFVPAEELRLNVTVPPTTTDPNRLGVLGGDLAGFPNGRRLTDDVIDIALQALEGKARPGHNAAADTLGDGVNQNDVPFGTTFPYVALPHESAVNQTQPMTQQGTTASGSGGFGGFRLPLALGGLALAGAGAAAVLRPRRRRAAETV